HDASGGLSFDSSLQRIDRTTFGRRAVPRINRDIGSFERVALPAAYRIRGKKPFHALEVSRRCTVTLVHVTATDPLGSGRYSDLIAQAVIANCRPHGMRAVANVIARERRIVAAGISEAVVNGVMPVVVVIGVLPVPTPVVRLECVVRPALTRISSADGYSLTPKTERPHIRCVGVSDTRLNRVQLLRLRRGLGNSAWLSKDIANAW